MKTRNHLTFAAIVALLGMVVAFTGCDNGGNGDPALCTCIAEITHATNEKCCEGTDCNCPIEDPKSRTEGTFNPLTFLSTQNYSTFGVTIKSSDSFLDKDWETIVNNVVAAIERGYNKDLSYRGSVFFTSVNKSSFETIFFLEANNGHINTSPPIQIIVRNTTDFSIEVKDDDYRTAYLKTSAINTVDFQPALWAMADEIGGYTDPGVPKPTLANLAFGENSGRVTISSSDTFTAADWDTAVKQLLTAIDAAYMKDMGVEILTNQNKLRFESEFATSNNAQIILVNNLANNWEIIEDDGFNVLYLKTSSISTADLNTAVGYMNSQEGSMVG